MNDIIFLNKHFVYDENCAGYSFKYKQFTFTLVNNTLYLDYTYLPITNSDWDDWIDLYQVALSSIDMKDIKYKIQEIIDDNKPGLFHVIKGYYLDQINASFKDDLEDLLGTYALFI
jgi:hypothetical protein